MPICTTLHGLGRSDASFNVYLANPLPLPPYNISPSMVLVTANELQIIGQQTSNHWRKIFNVYAKLLQVVYPDKIQKWQYFRDNVLFTELSNQNLIYSPVTADTLNNKHINIVMGKTYATQQGLAAQCHWLTPEFAINPALKLVICPYFDYRQLSNIKLTQLGKLIYQLANDTLPALTV